MHLISVGRIKRKKEGRPEALTTIPKAIRNVLKAHRKNGCNHFVIDSFRNPFEVEYFKQRFNSFYMFSISREKNSISALNRLTSKDIKEIHKKEKRRSGGKLHEELTSLDVPECCNKSDVFIHKRSATDNKLYTTYSLIRFLCLNDTPGCLQPNRDERLMQVALSMKYNSGCISRKVGAAICDKGGNVLGVGWNDVPVGNVPCSYRSIDNLHKKRGNKAYSEYERSDEFIHHIIKSNKKRYSKVKHEPFCFKQYYQKLKSKSDCKCSKKIKKAEFTRALHAEENAFFQALRRENDLSGCVLYTTDKTCNLCAKKAYQLGISRIVYIEDFPDDAILQTIRTGNRKIKVDQFSGIVGSAYLKLFSTPFPEKDILIHRE
ncbi:MAG: hypothetical protein HQL53_06395 [Magnetococcales bacterium]|nr:hypothetical protein [Magnetococcales bacterium]